MRLTCNVPPHEYHNSILHYRFSSTRGEVALGEGWEDIMIYNMIFSLFVLLISASTSDGFSTSGVKIASCRPQVGKTISQISSKIDVAQNRRLRLTELAMSSKDSDTNPFYKGQDAYQILEVPRGADKKDIKSSYRKAVSTWHPDKFPDDEKKKAEGNLMLTPRSAIRREKKSCCIS